MSYVEGMRKVEITQGVTLLNCWKKNYGNNKKNQVIHS